MHLIGYADSLERIARHWQDRLDATNTLYCFIEYTTLHRAGSANEMEDPEGDRPFPPEDWWVPSTNEMWFDMRDGRVRLELGGQVVDLSLEDVVSKREIRLFDGEVYQKFLPKAGNREQARGEEWVEIHEYGSQPIPMLFDYGVVTFMPVLGILPGRGTGRSTRSPKVPVDLSLYSVVAQRDNLVTIRSRNLRRPNAPGHPSYYELDVDLARDAAIVRYVGHRMGYQFMTVDYHYDEQQEASWIPSGWTQTLYGPDGRLGTLREAYKVAVELNADLSNIEFHVEVKPGMFVYSAAEHATYYQLTPEIRVTSEEGLRHVAQAQGRNRRMLRTFLTMLAVVGVAVSVGIWLRTHRRAGKDGCK